MINESLKQLQNEIESLQKKADGFDKLNEFINMAVKYKKETIPIESLVDILNKHKDIPTILWCEKL